MKVFLVVLFFEIVNAQVSDLVNDSSLVDNIESEYQKPTEITEDQEIESVFDEKITLETDPNIVYEVQLKVNARKIQNQSVDEGAEGMKQIMRKNEEEAERKDEENEDNEKKEDENEKKEDENGKKEDENEEKEKEDDTPPPGFILEVVNCGVASEAKQINFGFSVNLRNNEQDIVMSCLQLFGDCTLKPKLQTIRITATSEETNCQFITYVKNNYSMVEFSDTVNGGLKCNNNSSNKTCGSPFLTSWIQNGSSLRKQTHGNFNIDCIRCQGHCLYRSLVISTEIFSNECLKGVCKVTLYNRMRENTPGKNGCHKRLKYFQLLFFIHTFILIYIYTSV